MITQAWMIYPVMVLGSLAGIAGPSIQSFVSRQVSASEQGTVQGALASLMSLTGVVGPLAATQLFAFFTAPAAPVLIPGIGFYFGAVMSLVGVLFAFRTFRKPVLGSAAAA
jgi:DHA1 family tetracycline resistance protein-like MFS transporter